MSMYKQFATDRELEKKGITHDFGDFRVTLARAGNSNSHFIKMHELLTKPVRRLIDQDMLPPERELEIKRTLYARTIILNWEVKEADDKVKGDKAKWKQGIEAPDGSVLPFNEANVIAALVALPDLFVDFQIQANKMQLYLAANREADAKNS